MNRSKRKVLSLQSHVVSGYVGNKSACFPLQLLGFDVDAINSVQFSNHTAYKHVRGQVLCANDLKDLFEGLKLNNLHHYSHVLTGYVGSASFLSEVIEVIKDLREVNPDLCFVCDPVLGDNNKMYVPEDVLPVYRDHLIPLANVLTPNQFEAELLTGLPIKNSDDALRVMEILHEKGVETVILSSVKLDNSSNGVLFGSSIKSGEKISIKMEIPWLEANFIGTGDLFAATTLAWMSNLDGDLKASCENSVNTLQSVLQRTLDYARENAGLDGVLVPELLELQLIQSKRDIEDPKPLLTATILS